MEERNTRASDLLITAYSGSWREDAPRIDLDLEDLTLILGNLLGSGGVGLVWPRIRHRAHDYGVAGDILERAYLEYSRNLIAAEVDIATVVSLLANQGITPVLIKGLSASRQYPSSVVRRPGDIDLVVRPEEYATARHIVHKASHQGISAPIDLHHDEMWIDYPGEGFRDRLEHIYCNDVLVPTLGDEDNLRVLCHHFMRHYRVAFQPPTSPIWLCDIGRQIEARSSTFEWERFINNSTLKSNWITVAMLLCRDILGANLDGIPEEIRNLQLPNWIPQAVLHRWTAPIIEAAHFDLVKVGIKQTLVRRWPDPLSATVYCGAPIDDIPPLRYQWSAYLRRMVGYLLRTVPSVAASRLTARG